MEPMKNCPGVHNKLDPPHTMWDLLSKYIVHRDICPQLLHPSFKTCSTALSGKNGFIYAASIFYFIMYLKFIKKFHVALIFMHAWICFMLVYITIFFFLVSTSSVFNLEIKGEKCKEKVETSIFYLEKTVLNHNTKGITLTHGTHFFTSYAPGPVD